MPDSLHMILVEAKGCVCVIGLVDLTLNLVPCFRNITTEPESK